MIDGRDNKYNDEMETPDSKGDNPYNDNGQDNSEAQRQPSDMNADTEDRTEERGAQLRKLMTSICQQ